MGWRWQCEGADGSIVDSALGAQEFPTQADAETWIGETWEQLLAEGVERVSLLEETRVVYGPMGLRSE